MLWPTLLPELGDEAAWQLSEFLQSLAEHIDAHYSAQISRAHRAHEREWEQLYRIPWPVSAGVCIKPSTTARPTRRTSVRAMANFPWQPESEMR